MHCDFRCTLRSCSLWRYLEQTFRVVQKNIPVTRVTGCGFEGCYKHYEAIFHAQWHIRPTKVGSLRYREFAPGAERGPRVLLYRERVGLYLFRPLSSWCYAKSQGQLHFHLLITLRKTLCPMFLICECPRGPATQARGLKTRNVVWNLPPRQEGEYTTKGRRPNPLTRRRSGRPTYQQKSKLTRALSIAEDECYLKIYQRKPHPPNTSNSGHQTKIPTTPLPNII